jgi:hypothetical protein
MRTIWRVVVRTVFWSFERGTWPYDVAVVLIVVFVLLSPRSWFNDRPPVGPPPSPMVQLRDAASTGAIQVYRVDARLLTAVSNAREPEIEHQLHEAVRKNVATLDQSNFEIVRIDPVRSDAGAIAYYDVSIKP